MQTEIEKKKRPRYHFYRREQEEYNLQSAVREFYYGLLEGGSHGCTEEIKTKKGRYSCILKHERFDMRHEDDYLQFKRLVSELQEGIDRFDAFKAQTGSPQEKGSPPQTVPRDPW